MSGGLRAARGHGLAVALMIGVAGLIAASDELYASSARIIDFLEAEIVARPLAGQLLFVLLAMLSAMLAFFSSALLADLVKAKPATSKGTYLQKISVSSTMGPGVTVDQSSLALK